VIIATHNRPRLVTQCVESVLAQTYPADEIIVVDDGSRRPTARSLAPYAERGQIRYYWQLHQGWGAARLFGARCSRSAILVFLDDDCSAPPEWLARYADAYAAHPDTDGIGGGLRPGPRMNLAGRKQYSGHQAYFNRLNSPLGITADRPGRAWFTFGGNRSFRREVWLAAQPGRWSWYHDDTLIDLALRERGARIYHTPEAWVTHHYVLSVAQRLRAAYRYGRSEAQTQPAIPDDLPLRNSSESPSWWEKWRGLAVDYPDVSWDERAWYALTQPLTWIARRIGRYAARTAAFKD
jgi:glycosyltransferase involved in cell wall biosynthesis